MYSDLGRVEDDADAGHLGSEAECEVAYVQEEVVVWERGREGAIKLI